MKVLFLTPWYPDEQSPNHGIFIRNQAVAVSEQHEVQVVSCKIDYKAFGFCSFKTASGAHDKIAEHRLTVKRSLPVYNQLNYFLVAVWYTWKITRRFKPDLIHGNIGYPGAWWTWLISRLLSKPFVITEHTRLIHNFRSPFHRWLTVLSMRKASALIAVSRVLAGEIKSVINRSAVVIPNVVLAESFEGVSLPGRGNDCHIGFLGGMNTPIKGFDILLKALSPIQKKFHLHVAGSGKLADQYKVMVKDLKLEDRCTFYGFVPYWGVAEFFGRLNFVVSASRYESFGITLLEAVSCGLPVVCTRCGGPEDFITEACGKMVPVEDPAKLREELIWMIDNFDSFDPKAMKSYVRDHFSPRVIREKLNAIYQTVAIGVR